MAERARWRFGGLRRDWQGLPYYVWTLEGHAGPLARWVWLKQDYIKATTGAKK